jgi:hypothetical protein
MLQHSALTHWPLRRRTPCYSWLLLIARLKSEAALRKGVCMEGRHDRAPEVCTTHTYGSRIPTSRSQYTSLQSTFIDSIACHVQLSLSSLRRPREFRVQPSNGGARPQHLLYRELCHTVRPVYGLRRFNRPRSVLVDVRCHMVSS